MAICLGEKTATAATAQVEGALPSPSPGIGARARIEAAWCSGVRAASAIRKALM